MEVASQVVPFLVCMTQQGKDFGAFVGHDGQHGPQLDTNFDADRHVTRKSYPVPEKNEMAGRRDGEILRESLQKAEQNG